MARRKKKFSGTPEQHRDDAGRNTRRLRQATRDFNRLMGGYAPNCHAAIDALADAERALGALQENKYYATRSAARKRGSRTLAGSGTLVVKMLRKFTSKCVKP